MLVVRSRGAGRAGSRGVGRSAFLLAATPAATGAAPSGAGAAISRSGGRVEARVVGDELRLDLKPGESVRDASLSAQLVGRLERLAASGASRVELATLVTSPALQLTVAGANAVTGPITAGRMGADVSGASTPALSGRVQDLQLSATGTSQVPLSQLTARHRDADLSGVSRASVAVSDQLAARTSGVSVLEYRRSPALTRAQATGLSSIRHDFGE